LASIGSTWGDTPQNGTAGFSLPLGYVIEFNQNPVAGRLRRAAALRGRVESDDAGGVGGDLRDQMPAGFGAVSAGS
jgi:hypothetical protein